MCMRFQRDIRCAAASAIASPFESNDLGMHDAVLEISAFADDLAIGRNDHTSDQRVWRYQPDPASSKFECAPRTLLVNMVFYFFSHCVHIN